MKVHELAKKLGLENKQVIEVAKKNGIEVKSYLRGFMKTGTLGRWISI